MAGCGGRLAAVGHRGARRFRLILQARSWFNSLQRTMSTGLVTVFGQPSWTLASDTVELNVTRTGGQVGPVTFKTRKGPVQPYSVAPWAEEPCVTSLPPVVGALRGDFFCLPFGGNSAPHRGEQHPVHGETANAEWRLDARSESRDECGLHLSLRTKTRPGLVSKHVLLRAGHAAVYTQHVVRDMSGPMCLGHHAMLKLPGSEGSGAIATSPFVHGQVFPELTELPANGGYSSLRPGACFRSLKSVPMIDGQSADLSAFPARKGFEDIVMTVADATQPFAWTSLTCCGEGWTWIAFKDPQILRNTVMWFSNAGRHYAPWNGRHTGVVGLEEVTSFFHYGLAQSARPNALSRMGFPTCIRMNKRTPLVVNYITALVATPRGFDRVARVNYQPSREPKLELVSSNGIKVPLVADLGFLWEPAHP